MRYTNREKPFIQKFNLSVSRIEKNQRKIRGSSRVIIDHLVLRNLLSLPCAVMFRDKPVPHPCDSNA